MLQEKARVVARAVSFLWLGAFCQCGESLSPCFEFLFHVPAIRQYMMIKTGAIISVKIEPRINDNGLHLICSVVDARNIAMMFAMVKRYLFAMMGLTGLRLFAILGTAEDVPKIPRSSRIKNGPG